jgi:formylglycine-generating enzyme required for sulfatase activity
VFGLLFAFSCADKLGISLHERNNPLDPDGTAYEPDLPPTAPRNVRAMAGVGQVTITWDAVTNAASYRVYWTDQPADPIPGVSASLTATVNIYIHTGLVNETEYRYAVTAVNANGQSAASAIVRATPATNAHPPGAPTGVNATAGYGQITITWANVTTATSYNLYWSDDGSDPSKASSARIAGVTSPHVHSGLANGTAHRYVVTAANEFGESGESAVVEETPRLVAPAAPANVAVTVADRRNTITWSPVSFATSYNIYWTDNQTNPTKASPKRILDATSPHSHTGLTNGVEYRYVVTAQNAAGEGVESLVVRGTPLSAPTNVVAVAGAGQNTVTWNPAPGALGYRIYWLNTGANPTKATGNRILGAASPYDHTGLAGGTEYRYVVTATNIGGESAESAVATATPMIGTNIAGISFVWVPAGSFEMGSTNGDPDEEPVHAVQITRGFWMGQYEITQAQYSNTVGTNPSTFSGANRPVEYVRWYGASNFCDLLSAQTGMTVRLPTEAEWEYACRAGTTTVYHTGDTISSGDANINTAIGSTTDVGNYAPNAFGLYDMHGNVFEWCNDWYASGYYAVSPPSDPPGAASGTFRISRGGCWKYPASICRTARRQDYTPNSFGDDIGFRVVVRP